MNVVGHGIDLVQVQRIRDMASDHADRFLDRCFTDGERKYMDGARRYHEHLAARFAAKEAAMKALSVGLADGITWRDFEVVKLEGGAPTLIVRGRAAELASVRGINAWLVSLSHTDEHAIASVLALAR